MSKHLLLLIVLPALASAACTTGRKLHEGDGGDGDGAADRVGTGDGAMDRGGGSGGRGGTGGGTVVAGSGGGVVSGSGGGAVTGSGGGIASGSGGGTVSGSGGGAVSGSGGGIATGSGGRAVAGSGGAVVAGSGGAVVAGSGGAVVVGSGGAPAGSGGAVVVGSGGAPAGSGGAGGCTGGTRTCPGSSTCIAPAPTNCCNDGECPSAMPICNTGTHVCMKKALAQPCGGDGECGSGHCVDSRCCSVMACDVCQTCTAGNGSCLPVSNAVDPDSCPGLQLCDATSNCINRFKEYFGVTTPAQIIVGPSPNNHMWWVERGGAVGSNITHMDVNGGGRMSFGRPNGSAPAGLTIGSGDGSIWFTESATASIGKISSAGVVTPFALDAGSVPLGIGTGPDGNYWVSDGGPTPRILRIFFDSGAILNRFNLPAGDTATESIITGFDNNTMWFTEPASHKIGKITANATGTITTYAVTANSGPTTICRGPDTAYWFTERYGNKIGRITTSGVVTSEYPIPTPNSEPVGIALGPDGALWFTEYSGNKIARMTTAGVVTEYPVPTASAGPWGIVAGPDNNIWFTEERAGIGRFIPP